MSQRTEHTHSISARLQDAANIATLVVACLLSVALVKAYLPTRSTQRVSVSAAAIPTVSAGDNLKSQLPGVNLAANGETVVLALSTHCHFCTDSAPFFRQLSNKSGKDFKIVAVLPQSVAESQGYLGREGVHVDQLQQGSLEKLGVLGTPTMLLLDKSGVVRKSWVGKLTPEEQEEALKAIDAGV